MTPEEIAKEMRRGPPVPVSAVVIGMLVVAITVLLMLGWTSGTLTP